MLIPRYGSVICASARTRYSARADHSIAFHSEAPRILETGLNSQVSVRLDEARLLRTARGMLGLEDGARLDLALDQDRELALNPGALPMGGLLANMFQTMDSLPGASLALLSLDDLFYRFIVALLSPLVTQACVGQGSGRRASRTRREVDEVCQYVLAHLAEPISLSDMERMSGLSQRSLQLAFQKQFQCSPLQWVREARLDLARQHLKLASPGDTVTQIALGCGFTQLGSFSAAYFARFGEQPSETLRTAVSSH